MTGKEFINTVANGRIDIIQVILDLLAETGLKYCLIGGLAVNAYVEPVVSLYLDIVVAAENVETVKKTAEKRDFKVEHLQHSVNLTSKLSDLRIQLQTDPQYQGFIVNAETRRVLGYDMKVAKLGDVLQGKVWAYLDRERRKSKRQKDFADILRIIEAFRDLAEALPQSIRYELNKE